MSIKDLIGEFMNSYEEPHAFFFGVMHILNKVTMGKLFVQYSSVPKNYREEYNRQIYSELHYYYLGQFVAALIIFCLVWFVFGDEIESLVANNLIPILVGML